MNQLLSLKHLLLRSVREELTKEIPLLHQILSGSGMEDFILAPFEEILRAEHVSQDRLYYSRELCRHLLQLQPDSGPEPVEEILLYMNFNCANFLKFKLQLLSDNIHSYSTVHQQLTQTKWLLKMNDQQLEQSRFQFMCNQPSLKEQISEWLIHECGYLEHKLLHPENILLPAEIARWRSFKMKIDLSVNELAFLLRVMMEHGLIMNSNKSEVADFFATYFVTSSQNAISPDSLRRKMYNYPPASAEAVKQLLLDLFNTSKGIISA